MLLIASLLIQFQVAADNNGDPGRQGTPVNDLTAVAVDPSVELHCTVPFNLDGTAIDATDLQIRYSPVKDIETEDEWTVAEIAFQFDPGVTMASGSAISCVTNPLPNGTYRFAARVRTDDTNVFGDFPTVRPAPVTIGGGVGAVPPVTGLSVVPGSVTTSSVQLTWNALTGTAAQVMIYRSLPPSSTPTLEALPGWISGTTTITITGLASATTYNFSARSRDAAHVESLMSGAPYPFATTLAVFPTDPVDGGDGSKSAGCPQSATGSAAAWMLALAGLVLRRR